MRRRHLFWIASSLAIGLSACTTLRSPLKAPSPPRLDTVKACADWRWIGISRPGAQCPNVPGWTVRPLFTQVAPVQQQSGGDYGRKQSSEKVPGFEVIQDLNRFCIYEITDPGKSLEDPPFPPAASADLVRFDQDCAALSVAAETESAPEAWKPEFNRFLEQAVGKPRPLEINNRLGVRLAFLDTEPTAEGAPRDEPGLKHSWHGYTLAHIARQIVCAPGPDGHCAAQITTRLALPILDFDPKSRKHNRTDPVRGGYLGMQSDLAEAIRREVDDWRRKGLQQHLVLNLSLAWDGELFGGLDGEQIAEMRAGTQAVYRVLQYAAGFDVLVIAAAGNQKVEPCRNTGPLLPAAWERAPRNCGEPPDAPLLYAVGGVGSDGEAVGNARPSGMPPRAAYAENAVVPAWNPDRPTAMLTGSSVAAAVVSSIAAVVWDSFPDLDAHGVMKILEESGEPLSDADFWFGASAPPTPPFRKVHRLSLCTALEKACARHPSAPCPIQGRCETWQPEDLSRRAEVRPAAKGSCQPWLFPQPEDIPCLGCPPHKTDL